MAINEEKTITNENTKDSNPDLLEAINQPQHDIMMKMLRLEEGLLPEHKKILEDFAPNFMVNAEDLARIRNVLPTLTKLYEAGLLNDAMWLLELFLELQSQRIEIKKADKYLKQTANACKSHSKYNEETTQLLLALEPFLDEIEDKWHPKVKGNERKVLRNRKVKLKDVKKEIYEKHKTEIDKILRERDCQIDFYNAFSNAFDNFTDWYYELSESHTSRNGYPREQRASRSEEAKEKTRQKALENQKKKKEKK